MEPPSASAFPAFGFGTIRLDGARCGELLSRLGLEVPWVVPSWLLFYRGRLVEDHMGDHVGTLRGGASGAEIASELLDLRDELEAAQVAVERSVSEEWEGGWQEEGKHSSVRIPWLHPTTRYAGQRIS